MEVILARKARSDIASILEWTMENFGPQAMKRYGKLIRTAVEEVAANPETAGSAARPEISEKCRTYHLFHCRKKAGRMGERVRDPRHLLVYRVTDSGAVEIARVLHDSMESERHPPEE